MEINEIKAKLTQLDEQCAKLNEQRIKLREELHEYEKNNSSYYILHHTKWDYYNDGEETTVILLGYMTGNGAEKIANKHNDFCLSKVRKETFKLLTEMEIIKRTQETINELDRIGIDINSNVDLEEIFHKKGEVVESLLIEDDAVFSTYYMQFEDA